MKGCILKDRKYFIILGLSILLVWIIASKYVNNEVIIPSIKNTFISLTDIVKEEYFINTVKSTLLRSLASFLISLISAIILGILSYIFKAVYYIMSPVLKFLKSVPTMAIIILALIWLTNEAAPVFVGFIMVFPILYESVLKGISNIDFKIVEMSKLYKVDTITMVREIYVPSIFFNINSVLTSTLGLSLKMVIGGEVLGQPKYGIGSSLQLQKMYLNTPGVFAWIIIILVIINVFDYVLSFLGKLIGNNKWK